MENLWLKFENIEAKVEIARFEQFLLLSLCFQKAAEASESIIWRKMVNTLWKGTLIDTKEKQHNSNGHRWFTSDLNKTAKKWGTNKNSAEEDGKQPWSNYVPNAMRWIQLVRTKLGRGIHDKLTQSSGDIFENMPV